MVLSWFNVGISYLGVTVSSVHAHIAPPQVPPNNFTVTRKTPSSAEVCWTPIPIEEQNSFIIGYKVQFEGLTSLFMQEVLVEGVDAKGIGIRGLNHTSYTFNIMARTEDCCGPPISSVLGTLHPLESKPSPFQH